MSGLGPAFTYAAEVVRVYDGDSIWCTVDLGFGITHGNPGAPTAFRIRLIDTPEVRGPQREAGKAVGTWLRGLIEGRTVILRTFKGDKYGRWLCDVLIESEADVSGFINVGDVMVSLGYAKRYDGGTKEEWTEEQLAYAAAAALAADALTF